MRIAANTTLSIALGAVLVLSACSSDRRSEVLIGNRVGLYDVLKDQSLPQEPPLEKTEISLPAAKTNVTWAQPWGSPSARIAHPALPQTLELAWSTDIGAGNSRKQRLSAAPVVSRDAIFTLDSAAKVTAVSKSGAVLWSRSINPASDRPDEASTGALSYAQGRLYVVSNFGRVIVLDASTGDEIWTQDLDATSSAPPTYNDGLLYVIGGDDTAWALDAKTGRIRWQIGTSSSVANVMGAPSPALSRDLAVFAFGNGDIQAVFRRGGLRRWSTTVVGERPGYALSKIGDITAPPVIDGARIYVGNQSGRTVALALESGERLWTAKIGAAGPIWPAGDSLFFVSDQNELKRLSAQSGAEIWSVDLPKFTTPRRPRKRLSMHAHYGPLIAGGRVIIASSDGMLRQFDVQSGAELTSIEMKSGAATPMAVADGTLYLVNDKGQLLAFR
jgi:outer membrane protein assembly factor BamB